MSQSPREQCTDCGYTRLVNSSRTSACPQCRHDTWRAIRIGTWIEQAACADNDLDPNAWTGNENWTPYEARWIQQLAKDICYRQCPVTGDCLTHALLNNEHGIWGGTDDAQRQEQRRGERNLHGRMAAR